MGLLFTLGKMKTSYLPWGLVFTMMEIDLYCYTLTEMGKWLNVSADLLAWSVMGEINDSHQPSSLCFDQFSRYLHVTNLLQPVPLIGSSKVMACVIISLL